MRLYEVLLGLLAVVLLGVVALAVQAADVDAAVSFSNMKGSCGIWTLCDAEANTGACKDTAGSNEIVARLGGKATHKIDACQSTATGFTCDLYFNDFGYHATQRTKLTAASITDADCSRGFVLEPLDRLWAECTVIDDNVVTLKTLSCP